MRTLLISLMLMCVTVGFAQTTVTGTVVDQNNEPVPGTNLVIVGKAVGTVTDFDGDFTLETEELPPFKLHVTSIGYSDTTVDVTENNQTLAITIAESQTMLDEIVVSASRTPERIFESPVSVERFGLKEIKNTTAASFYGGLQNLKGVDVNTSSLTFNSVNTRGFATFANNRFLQLIDGMDNSAPGLNFVLGNLVGISELDVQSVEILSGASSALYGAGAFNGSLFMTSKNPFDFQGISFYAKAGMTSQEAAGDNQYYDFGIRAAHAFNDKFAVKANFSYLRGEDWHANRIDDIENPGFTRADPGYDGLNVYGDEVATTLNFDDLAVPDLPDGTIQSLPSGTIGSALVSRTGYDEADLADYGAESVKADLAAHYRPFGDDLEILYNFRVGTGTSIYQGANRYSLNGFSMQQHKFEIRNDNFFIRAYTTIENSGDSYDTRFAGINVNRAWKADTEWFGDYARTFIGAKLGVGTGVQLDDAAAHAAARAAADTGRLVPGTPEFQGVFNRVISDGSLLTGAKFIDKTRMRHVDANYNFSHITKDFADIQIGGSFREYELNSNGTIFTDTPGQPIKYSEFGVYTQLQKKMMDERLKLTASVRYDKNEFFDGFFSPRGSLVYTLGENRKQNIRVSVQRGFRNPTTQDLFIGLNAGRAVLVGSAPSNLDRDIRTYDLSDGGAAITGSATATVLGRAAYENAFSLSSVRAGAPEAVNTPLVKPEGVTAYELGYRAQFGKVSIDLSGYYNQYNDFISVSTVVVPFYGTAGDNALSLAALGNSDFKPYQVYTNSLLDINSYGGTFGIDAKVFGNFDAGINYTYAKMDFDRAAAPDFEPAFNTPEHKVKASFGHTALFENFGFNINYRWSDSFLWEQSFTLTDGMIPSFSVFDAQINYTVPSIKSTFKLGGSNILGDEYFSAIGTGNVGSIFYVGWTINQ